MKIKIFCLAIISFVSLLIISCSSSKQSEIDDSSSAKIDTVALIGNEVISLKEYEDFYIKNNGGSSAAQKATDESKKQFLDLLVKYRLKVKDAYQKNYEKDPAVAAEIKDYEKSLSIPYVLEKEITEPNLKVWYERRKKNMKIGAILVRTDWNNPKDTLEKFNLITSLIDSLNAGKNFTSLALKYSELPTIKTDSGMLGYVTAGQTVPIFEESVYSLKKGEYSRTPLKLKPGYIIPKLVDVEERTGGRKFAHILLQYKKQTKEDSLETYKKAESIMDELKAGAKFEDLVVKYSDDVDSKDKGGLLGSFERDPNLEPKDFWNELFKLKKDEISGPLKTWFGVHIVKMIDQERYPSYADSKDKLKEEYQSLKYNSDYQSFLNKLKVTFKFNTNLEALNEFYHKIDTTKAVSTTSWDSLVTMETRNKILFTYADKSVTVDTAIALIKRTPEFKESVLTPNQFKATVDRLTEILVMQYKAEKVPQEHPEFIKVMKEYVDGILLYKAEQESVWSKLSITDSATKVYYEANKNQFQFPKRADFSEIYVKSDSLIKMIYNQLTDTLNTKVVKGKKGKKSLKPAPKPTFDELAEKYTEREGYKAKKGNWGLMAETENTIALRAFEMQPGEITKPFSFENGFVILKLNKFEEPRLKNYEECGPELSGKFQESETKRLEGLWLESLKTTFPVKQFQEKLKDAFSSLNK
jgi:peptidyl-prolyl cis-trans isomerase SurA